MYKVSITIAVYNQEDLIIKALDSIPVRDDIEVIIVDDCSTDNTLENVKNYKSDLNIKIYHLSKNMGIGYCRTIGLKASTGEYVFGLDSDDSLITDKWSEVVDNYLDSNYDVVQICRIQNDGQVYQPCVAMHCHFVKRSTIGDLQFRNIRGAEDWMFMEDLAKRVELNKINTNIAAYRYNYPREGSLYWKMVRGESLENN